MNHSNKFFLKVIGVFFLLTAGFMAWTGYWPDLRSFGVSERTFGAIAVSLSVFTPHQKAEEA